ncbi:aromatic ring-hydroxylating dioxygenase subunit alpha [Sphaerisporangium sp. NPDC051017]|uniref:aromatic ring-hydroxylating oxygenase subunit alpha n=1 Tax=Sphaerisporangium sp. NPDC051017 TaxID=3154636 RepID=UPI003432853B
MTNPTAGQIMRDHIERGLGMPRELYMTAELFEQELEAIFNRSWLFAAHESQLARPGQYVTVESGLESVIVSRTLEGEIAAVHNVCRHRGARLLDAGCGSARRLVCPYHQWAYKLDGTMLGASKMPPDFDKDRYPLRKAKVATWQGLVFVNLDEEATPLADLLALGEDAIAPFDLPGATVAHEITYDVRANWKLVWENAQECYHCNVNHPELLRAFDVAALGDDLRRSDDMRVQCTRLGLKPGAVSLTVDGQPASSRPMLSGEPYTVALHLKPTFAVVCCPDYAVVLRDRPVAIDRTEVTMTWLVRADAEAGRDYDLDNLIKVWDQTNLQDWALCERTQLGVRSRFFDPGPLSGEEPSVAAFHQAYATMLSGEM